VSGPADAADRVEDPRGDHHAVAHERDHDREGFQAGGEVGRAIEGIYDPDVPRLRNNRYKGRVGSNRLFTHHARAGSERDEARRQQRFGLLVSGGDWVGWSLVLDLALG